MSSEGNFDVTAYFSNYLSALYHRDAPYDIQVLSGGLVNHTVRAIRKQQQQQQQPPPPSRAATTTTTTTTSTNNNNDDDKLPSTLILKYAPPFIACVGPEAPFSQDRQKVEAAALRLFRDSDGPLSILARETHIRIPHVMHHDPSASTLILQDLGTQYQVFWDALETHGAAKEFTLGLCRAYSAASRGGSRLSLRVAGDDDDNAKDDDDGDDDGQWGIFRSALILHGREMINQAVEGWWQLPPAPQQQQQEKEQLGREEAIGVVSTADMVRAGVWYLERAGEDVRQMLAEPNFSLLKEEDYGLMLSLFGLS